VCHIRGGGRRRVVRRGASTQGSKGTPTAPLCL
jgi:hypothetical protein